MGVVKTDIPGLMIIEPRLFRDNRGYFFESFSERDFADNVAPVHFVQANESKSCYGTLRGLHFQRPPFAQAKLIRVVKGRILDVAVDIRKGSPSFGKHVSVELSDDNFRQVFIPKGLAHGFVALTEEVVFQYLCDDYYAPDSEGGLLYNDPDLCIDWKIPASDIILSEKDKRQPLLKNLAL